MRNKVNAKGEKMGRKKSDEAMETLGIRLDRSFIDRLDKLAAKADVDRARLIRNILELEVKYLERVDKVGLFTFAVIMRDLEETLKAWVEGAKNEPENFVRGMGKAKA